MKSYKIDLSIYDGKVRELVSEAVQKKAFELGYAWLCRDKEIANAKERLLFLKPDGSITFGSSKEGAWSSTLAEEISASDFLLLTDASDGPAFKPFDKVLVRDTDADRWKADWFSQSLGIAGFVCVGGYFSQCVPYEGNEDLLGTTNIPE